MIRRNINRIRAINQTFRGFVVDDNIESKVVNNTTELGRISIIIPAYNAQDFIEECLDSIENQIYFKEFNNYEIIVGVDGCEKTLNKILEIKNKYHNLVVLNMNSNKGVYITINTLLSKSSGDYVLILGSDDFLDVNAFNILKKYGNYDIIRFKSKDFTNNSNKYKIRGPHDGVFLANKRVYEELGGYKPWRCAADTDFRYRASGFKFEKIEVDSPLYFRRVHENSLANKLDTKYGSKLRSEYKKQLGKGDKKIIPVINDFTVI